jgi:KipI family sensor histidine kinase inhibitor
VTSPTILPLGDTALLIRFADTLTDAANRAAIDAARRIAEARPAGVKEIVPGLVSVMLQLAPGADFWALSGEVRLLLDVPAGAAPNGATHRIAVHFDGDDLNTVAGLLRLSAADFIARHNALPLRVLATGFAPGFVYCGLHLAELTVPRREQVRPMVPAGTVLFAAGQTAIAATPIRTGWHVIGRTSFQNFDAAAEPPTLLRPGDMVGFEVAP